MKKNIVIFGGAGFIGQNLIAKLKDYNFTITSVSRKKPLKRNQYKKVKYISCDVSRLKDFKKIGFKYQYIINLSGNIDHKNKKQTLKTHFIGCKNIMNHFKNTRIEKFIQIGSSLEYGKLKPPHSEKDLARTNSIYGSAKMKATNFVKNFSKKNKIPYIILRLYQIYGPYQKFDRLIPFVIRESLKNKNFNCTDGNQFRDFTYVDDLIRLFIKILKNKNNNSGIYNVGSGKPIKIKSAINQIVKIIKKGKPLFGKIKMRKDEIKKSYPNIYKVKKTFNWKPNINFYSGIKRTIKYYEKYNSTS